MTTDALKKQAREHEQNEAWEKALELYRRALEETEMGEEPEISLFNRVADLELRLGNVEAAMEQYERAIDLYMESDLPNNAIAICRKILRNVPGRAETFLRMGEIRAKQGFGVDARQNVLTYAEMMEERGDSEAATAALEELIGFFPADTEARVFLGERLVGLGDVEGGVQHLVGAWQQVIESGSEEAEGLEKRIRDLDPDVSLSRIDDSTGGSGDAPGPVADEVWGAIELPAEGMGVEEGAGAGPLERFLVNVPERTEGVPDLGKESAGEGGAGAPGAEVLEPTGKGTDSGFDAISFGEITLNTTRGKEEETDQEEAGQEIGDDVSADGGDAAGDDATHEASPFGDLPDFDLAGDDEGAEGAEDAEGAPLPLLGESGLSEAEAISLAEVAGPEEWTDAATPSTMEEAEVPSPLELLHDLVEQAHASGDRSALLASLGGLAAALSSAGDLASATAVHEQVLQLDPRNTEALAALGRTAPPNAPPPRKTAGGEGVGAPAGGGFVDLGALVLDDEETPTTRWVVEDERSGDEDADFAHMLSKFKAKVAQHITRDDARASYDLGTAYREMGLLDEAIGMFQQALRSQPGHLASLEMLGQCFLDREEPEVAIRVLERALKAGVPVEDDLLGIYYFLGVSHERAGNRAEAREFYEKVFSLDINFKDVTERLRALR